jgi:uncharacterized protein YukE
MKSSVMKALLKIARRVLQGVVGEITKQMNVVQELSEAVTSRFIPMLDTWEGPDADEFRQEVLREIIPLLVSLVGAIMGIQTGLDNALTRVEDTDKKCVGHVDNLAGQFRSIFQ